MDLSHRYNPASLEVLIRASTAIANDRRVEASGVVALPLGRGRVWRLAATDGSVAYARICRDQSEFRRCYSGLEFATKLAAFDERFSAASVLHTDATTALILTSGLPGSPLSALIRSAYRVDQNPFRIRERINRARRAIESVVEWINAFHRLQADRTDFLNDFSRTGCMRRITFRLKRLPSSGRLLGLQQLLDSSLSHESPASLLQCGHGLMIGDASLGNFILDRERVGVVDFEDLGVGAQSRDFVVLRSALETAFSSPAYRHDRVLFNILPPVTEGDPDYQLARAELCLEQLEVLRRDTRLASRWRLSKTESQFRSLLVRALDLDGAPA